MPSSFIPSLIICTTHNKHFSYPPFHSEAEPANGFTHTYTQATGVTRQFSCGDLPPGGPQERAAGKATPAKGVLPEGSFVWGAGNLCPLQTGKCLAPGGQPPPVVSICTLQPVIHRLLLRTSLSCCKLVI